MHVNPFKVKNSVSNAKGLDSIQNRQTNNVNAYLDHSHKLKYLHDEEQFQTISRLLKPKPIFCGSKMQDCPHPVAAELNALAYKHCLEVASRFKDQTIEFGGTPLRTPNYIHMDVLINDYKTEARYTEAAFNQLNVETDRYDMRSFLTGSHQHCTKGGQYCSKRAIYGFMVNVYDIPLETIVDIFIAHNLTILDAWMFLPTQLISPFVSDPDVYRCAVNDDVTKFDLLDNSDIYIHNTKIWRQYMSTTVIKCENFSLSIEHKMSYGSFTQIRFTRVSQTLGYKERRLCVQKFTEEVIVPNLYLYANANVRSGWDFGGKIFKHYIKTGRSFVEKVINYGTGMTDQQFNYNTFASYCMSYKNSVKFDQGNDKEVVYEGIDPESHIWEELKISLYIIAAVYRYKRTSTISRAFKHLQQNPFLDAGFWARINNDISKRFRNLFDEIFSTNAQKNLINADFLGHADIIYPEDYYANDVLQVSKWHIFEKLIQTRDPRIATTSLNDTGAVVKSIPVVAAATTPMTGVKCKYIYDPPGDGLCGHHVIKFWADKYGISVKYPQNLSNSRPWLTTDEVIAICQTSNMNCALHADAEFFLFDDCGSTDTVHIDLTNGHYRAVSCHASCTAHVGGYDQIVKNQNNLYVNAANAHLTDGAGQAAAFADMFPGYSSIFKIPVVECQIGFYNGNHLAAAVAHDFRREADYQKVHNTYDNIFRALEQYADANDLKIMLPLIGTAIYGTPLCCFKTALSRRKQRRFRICFFNAKQKQDYDKTQSCRHGGYKELVYDVSSVTDTDDHVPDDPRWYHLSNINDPNRMSNKYYDTVSFISDLYNKKNAKASKFIELAAAPGHFYKAHSDVKNDNPDLMDYITCVYEGPDAFPPTYIKKPDYIYDDIAEFINGSTFDQHAIFIYDNYPETRDLCWIALLFQKYRCSLITKTNAQKSAKWFFDKLPAELSISIFRNEGSNVTSSEIFIVLSNEFAAQHGNTRLDRQKICDDICSTEMKECKCDLEAIDVMINADINFRYRNANTAINNLKAHFLEALGKNLDIDIPSEDNITLPFINGAPGFRKTQHIIKNSCSVCSHLVSPFRAIVNDLNIGADKDSIKADTFVKCLDILKHKSYTRIFIDEAPAMSPMIVSAIKKLQPKAQIICMGDSNQIDYRNYDSLEGSWNIKYREGKKFHNVTYRVPKNICDLFRAYVDLESKNPDPGVVEWRPLGEFSKVKVNKQTQAYVFTQEAMRNYSDGTKIQTVNSVQGRTATEVHLYCDDVHLLREDKVRYVYTAMSRVKHKLVMYTDKPHEVFLSILGTPVERAMETFDVLPVNEIQVINEPAAPAKHSAANTLGLLAVPQCVVEDILAKIYIPSNDVYTQVIEYKSDVIPPNLAGHRFKTQLGSVVSKSTTINGRRFGIRTYQKSYHGSDQKQVVDCMLTRYAKADKKLNTKVQNMCYEAYNRWLVKDTEKIMRRKLQAEGVYRYTVDYLIELQKKYPLDEELEILLSTTKQDGVVPKGLIQIVKSKFGRKLQDNIYSLIEAIIDGKNNKFDDLEKEWYESYHDKIQFHLKRQPKDVQEPGYDSVFKAGQGISAWSKMLNCVFSGFCRFYSANIKDCLKSNVQLAFGASDADLSTFFRKYAQQLNDTNKIKFMADISEFDSSQEEKAILASAMMLKGCGISSKVVDFYVQKRSKWSMVNLASTHNETLATVLNGEWKQHSGQPFTLDGNTMYNMMLIGICYRFDDLTFASFKGDDSYICATRIQERFEGNKKVFELCGYKIKGFMVPIGEYIANIVLPNGKFFPDVVRRTSRMLSKIYTTKQDWAEIRKSIADCLDVIETDADLHTGAECAARFYQFFGKKVTADEIILMVNFLKRMTTFEDINDIPIKEWRIESITP